MNKLIMTALVLLTTLFTTEKGMAESCHHHDHARSVVILKGGGTYVFPNNLSEGFGVNVVELEVKARGNHLTKGTISISTDKVGPVDRATGSSIEAKGVIDAVRVFERHPGVIWIHGHYSEGFVQFAPFGLKEFFNSANSEFYGAVTTWGRTNILSILENDNHPLPPFFTSTEERLIHGVDGFSRILLTNGAKPAKMIINTPEEDIIIQ
ncbi:MAG: hypothetical protein ACHQUC_02160 [Chlamydiales bacterium]